MGLGCRGLSQWFWVVVVVMAGFGVLAGARAGFGGWGEASWGTKTSRGLLGAGFGVQPPQIPLPPPGSCRTHG